MITKPVVIRVKDVMKTEFGTIDGIATVAEALRTMKALKTSVLIVNKRHDDDEYGLINSGDIARHVLAKDRAPERVNVYEIMSKPVISVHPDMDIRYCSRLFADYNLVRAPVIANREVIGMVSPNSLVLDGLYLLSEQR
ncbi:CBS domain-containing protein [Methylovulum psychrotolerans]|jgi:CBS domain-containing protein|uniref:CBS domain-containing protein n=1 Tax=Methylovulum psychrotolerans TaxID=1704499 RepID=A0A1Z4BV16_9GAMM|nr:CBS domain-containing protein [Methylovulum psychrotolerans]ASF45118.1 histidine kinase [Methylovulum psychrotolerans]MBT9097329.1 CBS domain-containing protein [Methylovulum psychrotolerans]POZ50560.1 CBS domain-containing protein [Methylovulum psychrotolerans]